MLVYELIKNLQLDSLSNFKVSSVLIRETPADYNVLLWVRMSAMLSISERAVDLSTRTVLPDVKAASSVPSLDHVAFTV